MNERSKEVFEKYGHVPAQYDFNAPHLRKDGHSCYLVHADNKNGDHLDFIVFAPGYKDSWHEGRNQVRLGSPRRYLLPINPEFDDSGNVTNAIEIEPGEWKVRSSFSLDRKPRREAGVVTGKQLLTEFVQRDLGSKNARTQLRQLLEELEQSTGSADNDDEEAA